MSKDTQRGSKSSHSDPDHGSRGQNKRHVEGSITVHGQLETHLPPDHQKKQDTRDEQAAGRDKKRFIVEILTLFAVIIGAGLTGLYVYFTHEALSDAREHFTKDERPWVWLSSADYLPMQPGSKVQVNEWFINYGKSPAIHIRTRGKVFIGNDAFDKASKWFDSLPQPLPKPSDVGSLSVLPQQIPADPRNTNLYFTNESDEWVSKLNIDFLLGNSFVVVSTSRVQYEDVQGNIYYSDVCSFRFQNGSIGHCTHHNEVH